MFSNAILTVKKLSGNHFVLGVIDDPSAAFAQDKTRKP
jgi:hypothetical protein